jgi:hypothetical protein
MLHWVLRQEIANNERRTVLISKDATEQALDVDDLHFVIISPDRKRKTALDRRIF